ncbi:MAG TPA: trypsin-like peptidase domain-containing protein [Candidatus Limnocylindrales bacterium]|nr:trypsin-like peptidase domain-containing protein [Candidatus Limnocylindrales bacterium]
MDQRETASYSPPYSQSSYWAPRTPDHWLEPLPDRQAPGRGGRGPGLGMLLAMAFVALIAGGIGAGGTYLALEGREPQATASPVANAPTPTPMVAVTPAQVTFPPADAGAVSRVADVVSPAVVTITGLAGEAEDPFTLPETGVGSGVIFDPEGWILTNRHVVADVQNVRVQLNDRREFAGRVYGVDTLTDLAIVKIDGIDLPAAEWGDSAQLRPGQLAIAIGSPLGTFTNSVTSGVISALGRNNVPVTDPVTGETRRLNNLIQTDAAINPGNSGGPLVNEQGEVVGINTAVATGAQGIGFAIPINIAKPIMRQALAGEPIERPWIGISYVAIDRNIADREGLPIDYGAWISPGRPTRGIVPGSPAEEAGLREGDIVTAINGRRVDANNTLDEVLAAFQPGDTLVLMVLRDGEALEVTLTLGVRPPT